MHAMLAYPDTQVSGILVTILAGVYRAEWPHINTQLCTPPLERSTVSNKFVITAEVIEDSEGIVFLAGLNPCVMIID